LINKDNLNLLSDFLEYLRSVDRSPQTIQAYHNDLMIFFTWNMETNNNKFFIDVNKRDIMHYQSFLMGNHNSPCRVRRLKASLSSMSEFIENMLDDEYPLFRNIVNKIESPAKEATREKTILSDKQVNYLLSYLCNRKEYLKACVVALAMASGARRAELVQFKTKFFDDSNIVVNGAMYKTPEKIRTKGRGVNGKQLYKYTFVREFKPYFDLWMKQRKELGIDNEYLFVHKMMNGNDKVVTTRMLNYWAQEFSKILNVDFYWHSLRHYWVTSLKSKGLPDSVIVALQGWDKISGGAMVAIYNDEDVDESILKFFDSNGIIKQSFVTLDSI
jgi:site-specific recombinase XerD